MKPFLTTKIQIGSLACVAACILSFVNSGQLCGSDTFTNPLLSKGADPWVIQHAGDYYYLTYGPNSSLVLMCTSDITALKSATSQTVWKSPANTNYSKQVWAPEIHRIHETWYIYFAADDGDNKNHRMFVLENDAADPFDGEFVMKAKIQTDADDNWAIDGSVFEHHGELYFLWSGWEKPTREIETANIYIAHMANPWTIDSERVRLSTPEFDWERQWKYPGVAGPNMPVYVNEGPQFLKRGNKLHIVYSASGCWTPYYSLGLLTTNVNSDLLDAAAWSKSKEPTFSQSTEHGVYGPGHNSFFKSPDGTEDWVLYHANDSPTDGCGDKRSPRAQKFGWTDDDFPILGVPASTDTRLQKPSGTE